MSVAETVARLGGYDRVLALARQIAEEEARADAFAAANPLVISRLWRPVCHLCGSVLVEAGELFRCQAPGCALRDKPAPADLGCPELRALLDQDRDLAAAMPEGYRTSQQRAMTQLGEVFTLAVGGNRVGKSHGAAQLAVAFAQGREHPATVAWAEANGFDLSQIPNAGPGIVYAVALTSNDSRLYVRPKLDLHLPTGTERRNWTGDGDATANLPGPGGEAPDPKGQPGRAGFHGRIVCKGIEQGRRAFQGTQIVFAWFDEEPLDMEVVKEVEMRCADERGRILFSMTPLNGLSPLYHRFVERLEPGVRIHELVGIHNPMHAQGREGWMARVVRLVRHAANSEPVERLQRLIGRFGQKTGLVYAAFSRALNVRALAAVDSSWAQLGGVDFGYTNPFAYLHGIVDPRDFTIWITAEHYQAGALLAEHALAMREIWGRPGHHKPAQVWADSAGPQEIRELQRLGVPAMGNEKGAGSVRAQITEVLGLMRPDPFGRPHLFVDPSCVNLIREVGLYSWPASTGKANDKEEPVDKDNHALDALRYLVHHARRNVITPELRRWYTG